LNELHAKREAWPIRNAGHDRCVVGQAMRLVALLCGLQLAACANDDSMPTDDACLDALPSDCMPVIDSSYAEIYGKVINQRCGVSDTGTTCHGQHGLKGNLGLFSADEAYNALLGNATNRARVIPGDPKCSILMRRLESQDPKFRMPLGEDPLSPGLRCAIQTWIEHGAPR
jgi:hypothetical protein